MIDFKKRLTKRALDRPVEPLQLYDRLDRESGKGPLRPAQEEVLSEWHAKHRTKQDLILKLHTGQGKTLIGLVMLQSYLHESDQPALYLCPNDFLVNQTLAQARQFGINCVPKCAEGLPPEFENAKAILVTNVQTLFNGRTRFGLGAQFTRVNALCLDDAHACIEYIRQASIITLEAKHLAYPALRDLFKNELIDQGTGTYADIRNGDASAVLPIPYWAWQDRHTEIASILSKHSDDKAIRFAWPLLRNMLSDCLCVVSGGQLQIAPYQPPVHLFGTYTKAAHRIYMSATVADDSFLVRALGVAPEVVENPLRYSQERWSGEKMLLLPELIDDELSAGTILNTYARNETGRRHGIVVLCPSFARTQRWQKAGADFATTQDIQQKIDDIREGGRERTLAVANRYDGIDLPDDVCRILIIDGAPSAETLLDRHLEGVREDSDIVRQRIARTIEQGLGRAVRGEKDYCVILLLGADLLRLVRTKRTRAFLSAQTLQQIDIGLEIAEAAREDIRSGTDPLKALQHLVKQCLGRDEGWKEFYIERMNALSNTSSPARNLAIFTAERKAEEAYQAHDHEKACVITQHLMETEVTNPTEKGWYLQERARYSYPSSKATANELQLAAHRLNPLLLKPRTGMTTTKLTLHGQQRAARVIEWVRAQESYQELNLTLEDVLASLQFGVRADRFERALDDLAPALGFAGQRPDKQYGAGPDNLWAIRDSEYILFECKSEVELHRAEIHKGETGQINNAIAWFHRNYPGALLISILIIPTKRLNHAAGVNEPVNAMRERGLRRLCRSVRSFYSEFRTLDLQDISEGRIQTLLETHGLDTVKFPSEYSEHLS